MQIDSTYMTIMNCHLAAGETSAAERLQDLEYIHNDGLN
jgi:pentatricopeptide repeat protein